jgi:long-chain acyl-CoA synthetase
MPKMAGREKELPRVEADTLPKYLRLNTVAYGERTYMRRKNRGVWQGTSWNRVYEAVRAFSLGLMELGLARGETVAIAGENEPELFWADFAVLCAGGKVVCLYPDMTPEEMAYILDHSEAHFFVAEDQEQIDKFLEIQDRLPRIRKAVYWDQRGMWQYKNPILMEFSQVQELGRRAHQSHPQRFDLSIDKGKGEDIALLSYTSGTTGLPKGVIISQSYLLDNAFRTIMANEFEPFSQYLSYLSPAWVTEHFFAAIGVILPLTYNFPEEPETILANIRELGAEILVFGPRQWESLASTVQAAMLDAGPIRRAFYHIGMKIGLKRADEQTEGLESGWFWRLLHPLAEQLVLGPLRDNLGLKKTYFALTGGAPCAPDVFRFYHAMGVRLRNAYGNTECGMFTQHQGDRFDPETLGKWYTSHPEFGPPLEYRVDENGGLQVRGASGFSGYYKNEEAIREAVKDGWYITGDATRMKENGDLIFLDRVKDLKRLSSGHHFPPQFIETRFRFSPFIKDGMVLGDEQRPFVAALINIDSETVGRWAERQGIPYTTFPDLSQKPEVCDLIRGELERVNRNLDEPSRVKRFVNLPKEFDPDEAELTRTRKLRRGFLEERYSGLIEAVYGGQEFYEAEVPVKYRDGRTGQVKTNTRINPID